MAGERGRVELCTVHPTRVALNAHPDVIEVKFRCLGCVEDLLTCVANSKSFCDGVGVSIILEDHRSAARLNEFHNGVDFGGRKPIARGDGDEAIVIKLWQGECICLLYTSPSPRD